MRCVRENQGIKPATPELPPPPNTSLRHYNSNIDLHLASMLNQVSIIAYLVDIYMPHLVQGLDNKVGVALGLDGILMTQKGTIKKTNNQFKKKRFV